MAKKEENDVIESKVTKKEKSVKKEKKNSFKEFKTELKKVTWPTPKELVNKTLAVVVSVLIVALIVFVFDVIFENAYNFGTGALKSIVTNEEVVEDTTGENLEVEDTTSEVLPEEANTAE